MKIRALIGVWLVALMGLAMCGAGLPDIGLSSNRGKMSPGLKTSVGNGGGGQVDTVRVLSRVRAFPNSAAITAGYVVADSTYYTHFNTGSAGEAVRWGYCLGDAAQVNTVYYSATNEDYYVFCRGVALEDDIPSWPPVGMYMGFLWFSANGISNGDKIESARIIFNPAAFSPITVPPGGYIAARLDTVGADYTILNGTTGDYGNTDVARFDMSWNEIDATGNVAWSPTLATRNDRHDFGPRSNTVIGPDVYAVGTAMSLDVTDAVQQASDNGTLGRGLLFHIYGGGTAFNFIISAGTKSAWVGTAQSKGCPVFTATATSRRGPKPWNGTARVPVAVVFDDQYPVQSSYFTAMESAGKQFEIAAFRNAVNGYTWVDSLYALKPNLFGLVHHSRTHASLGTLTAAQIHPELARVWFLDEFTGFTASDTLGVVDSAWPAGGSTPNTGVLAASMMVDYGYRSARGYGTGWTATNLGLEYETWPSWSGWFNAYNYRAIGISNLTGAASMADKIGDYVDLAYTDHAKSALVFYGHRNTTAPADGITPAKLTEMIGVIDAANSCEIMPLETIMGMRLNGATFGSPQAASAGARLIATTDSVTIRKTAAVMDSLYRADADPNLLEMWAAPK